MIPEFFIFSNVFSILNVFKKVVDKMYRLITRHSYGIKSFANKDGTIFL